MAFLAGTSFNKFVLNSVIIFDVKHDTIIYVCIFDLLHISYPFVFCYILLVPCHFPFIGSIKDPFYESNSHKLSQTKTVKNIYFYLGIRYNHNIIKHTHFRMHEANYRFTFDLKSKCKSLRREE